MFLANIESLIVGLMPMPSVIMLRANDDNGSDDLSAQVLPIWIGPMEATSIAAALDERRTPRPLTHELAHNMVRTIGGRISRVVIDRVEGTTFYAAIYMRSPSGMFTRVDARPSDAIALAIKANAPLFIEEAVMEAAACPRSFRPGGEDRIELEEFHKFIEDVNPEDFVTHGPKTQ